MAARKSGRIGIARDLDLHQRVHRPGQRSKPGGIPDLLNVTARLDYHLSERQRIKVERNLAALQVV